MHLTSPTDALHHHPRTAWLKVKNAKKHTHTFMNAFQHGNGADSEGHPVRVGAKTTHHRERCALWWRHECSRFLAERADLWSVADGHEILTRADKILRVIKKNRAEKYLEMFTKIAEKNDDQEKFYEQFGECSSPGNREDSTIGAKIAELLTVNASKSEDEQLSLKECVDRMNGDPNDIYSIIGESIASVSSFLVLGILRKKSLEEEFAVQQHPEPDDGKKLESAVKVQKTVEVPQVQYIDKTVDVPVVKQGQVHAVQAVQKTVEVPQVEFHDRVVDVLS